MTGNLLEPTSVSALSERFTGRLVTRADADYEDVRSVFNAMLTARPQVIAQCADPRDVAAAIEFARANGLEIAVRSGGHSVAGSCLTDGGLVIDTRPMSEVTVDPALSIARVGGGASWGDFDRATQPFGLATTGGRVSTTGVAGLTLGGGSGWIERKFGLSCDNLLSVELVTADGREVTASEEENPELFWALHGGGGNFGVATALTFRLHRLPEFSMALLLWPADEGRAVAGVYRDLLAGAPDEAGGGLLYLTGPPEEFVPEQLVGRLCCGVLVTYVGGEAALREFIAPLLATGPRGQVVTDIGYADLQCMLDDPPGYRNYWSDENLRALPDEALDRFCERAADMVVPSPSQHALLPWGGAVARGADWPGFDRRTTWAVHPLGLWEDPADDDRAIAWARNLRADMRPWAAGDVYLNFIGDEGTDRVIAGYGEQNYGRLARVKAEFDPDNVFHRWHNVLPAR
ncbi:FAD-binding oxidoreductase [Prauserella muralis]|uniref:FAD-binding protein n=1 Tax=Prauserella muralis TaxID=588067 RepID=A0A2V4AZT6_9PSEU|nr:FAD-binding oxidoreductase [Prauserella muralis]PXY27253.1 FAD-binding protein [Prauserella muralis]TWE23084.1 FAD/FMN-containing dehydrogenase [Prauserella muralis]